jgi:hypothetical protein
MADVQLWEGGRAVTQGVDCGGCKENAYPGPHRLAAHRRRSAYLLGGAFDPTCDQRNRDCFCQLVATDTVWLALIPEDALFLAVRTKVTDGDAGGLVYTVVAETFDLDTGAAIAPVVLPGTVAGLATSAPLAVYAPLATPTYTTPYGPGGARVGIRVGVQVDTLPTGGACTYGGRIELSVLARDFETAQIADCRLTGSCFINLP